MAFLSSSLASAAVALCDMGISLYYDFSRREGNVDRPNSLGDVMGDCLCAGAQ
jgi:hypothetical protein